MKLLLKIWRQKDGNSKGNLVDYPISGIEGDMSFLEMLDVLNQQLIEKGEEPVVFDHDCREGICGACSLMINGEPHGPDRLITTCQLHMRKFSDGDTIVIEPFRANAFPVVKDLMIDRSAFDRIQQAGGYISVNTSGHTVDANAIPIEKDKADDSFAAATCIGCGACIASCPYDARYSHPGGHVDKCTFCIHRIKKGLEPACVSACPTKCMYFGDLDDPNSPVSRILKIRKSKTLIPEAGTDPQLYFLI